VTPPAGVFFCARRNTAPSRIPHVWMWPQVLRWAPLGVPQDRLLRRPPPPPDPPAFPRVARLSHPNENGGNLGKNRRVLGCLSVRQSRVGQLPVCGGCGIGRGYFRAQCGENHLQRAEKQPPVGAPGWSFESLAAPLAAQLPHDGPVDKILYGRTLLQPGRRCGGCYAGVVPPTIMVVASGRGGPCLLV
jgi:hypothetical protein